MFATTRSLGSVRQALVACALLLTACADRAVGPAPTVVSTLSAASLTLSNEAGGPLGLTTVSACGVGMPLYAFATLDMGSIVLLSVPPDCYDVVVHDTLGIVSWQMLGRSIAPGSTVTVHLLPGGRTTVEQLQELRAPQGAAGTTSAGGSVRASR